MLRQRALHEEATAVAAGSRYRVGGHPKGSLRAGVAFLTATITALSGAPTAAAQIAAITVSAQVVAVPQPEVLSAAELDPAQLSVADSARPDLWTERRTASQPWVIRSRLRRVRNEPRIGDSDAGLVLDVVLEYLAN